jgi:hypothetical protein
VKPAKFQQVDNYLTFADSVGGAFNHFNGVDFTLNARLREVTVQGGFSTGNVVEDSCGVVKNHPETYIFGPWGGTDGFLDTFLGGIGQWPPSSCHRESGWKTNHKWLATYNVPKIDMLLSGTFRSLPYPGNEFPSVQSQSIGAQALAVPNLGRPISSGNVIEFLNIVKPGELYSDRINAVDLRFGKVLRYSTTKTLVSLDIFNLFNSNTTQVFNQNYGPAYLNPLSIMSARFFKIGVQFDF